MGSHERERCGGAGEVAGIAGEEGVAEMLMKTPKVWGVKTLSSWGQETG